MSAPLLWIILPILLGGGLLFVRNQRFIALVAGIVSLLLATAAVLLPIDTLLTLGALNLRIDPALEVLGRRLLLNDSDRSWLTLLHGASAFWFAAAASIRAPRRFVPLSLVITGLMAAALAVEPFLYAALLLETAVLVAVPMLVSSNALPGKGALRFLIYQTLAMPFLLFSGWLLAGLEANPGNLDLVTRAALLLGVGFSLLLAIFPFYSWIPLLAEEGHPYMVGFILWIFPTVAMFFGLSFLDRYAWIRESASLHAILTTVGIVTIVSAGFLAFFERHLGRMMGFAVLLESGFSLLSLGLGGRFGFDSFLLLLLPRLLALAVWSLALSNLREHDQKLTLDALKGAGRIWSFSSASAVLACLALAGIPLLASFPPHLAIWDRLATQSLISTTWVLLGSLGLTFNAIRMLSALARAPEGAPWGVRESWSQRVFFLAGWLLLLLLGILPSWGAAIWSKLPPLFEHLGQ